MVARRNPRSRRLRKKLRVDEFQQLGFELDFKLRPNMEEAETWAFWDAFIDQAIEMPGLSFGGGESGFVVGWGRMSCTDAHRESVRSWLESRAEVSSVVIGPLVDAWHEPGGNGA